MEPELCAPYIVTYTEILNGLPIQMTRSIDTQCELFRSYYINSGLDIVPLDSFVTDVLRKGKLVKIFNHIEYKEELVCYDEVLTASELIFALEGSNYNDELYFFLYRESDPYSYEVVTYTPIANVSYKLGRKEHTHAHVVFDYINCRSDIIATRSDQETIGFEPIYIDVGTCHHNRWGFTTYMSRNITFYQQGIIATFGCHLLVDVLYKIVSNRQYEDLVDKSVLMCNAFYYLNIVDPMDIYDFTDTEWKKILSLLLVIASASEWFIEAGEYIHQPDEKKNIIMMSRRRRFYDCLNTAYYPYKFVSDNDLDKLVTLYVRICSSMCEAKFRESYTDHYTGKIWTIQELALMNHCPSYLKPFHIYDRTKIDQSEIDQSEIDSNINADSRSDTYSEH